MPTFTIMGSGIGYIGGTYKNDVPFLAAKKAGRILFKKLEDPKYSKHKSRKSIKFVLRMKDRSGPGKTYSYQVIKEKLKKPILIKVKNTEYYVKYNYSVKACDLSKKEKKVLLGGYYSDDNSDISNSDIDYQFDKDIDNQIDDSDDLNKDVDTLTDKISNVEITGGKKKIKGKGKYPSEFNQPFEGYDDIEKEGYTLLHGHPPNYRPKYNNPQTQSQSQPQRKSQYSFDNFNPSSFDSDNLPIFDQTGPPPGGFAYPFNTGGKKNKGKKKK